MGHMQGDFLKTISVNGKEFEIVKLLGKGKGGYSYLAKRDGNAHPTTISE